ncbi:hypothetical protein D3C73_1262610 [compost metagenome]
MLPSDMVTVKEPSSEAVPDDGAGASWEADGRTGASVPAPWTAAATKVNDNTVDTIPTIRPANQTTMVMIHAFFLFSG